MDKTQRIRKGKVAGIMGSICRELLTSEIRPKDFVAPFKFYVTLTDAPSPDFPYTIRNVYCWSALDKRVGDVLKPQCRLFSLLCLF